MTFDLLDLGLALIRVVVGGVLLAHGLQKLGYLGGGGLERTATMLESGLRFRPGSVWAPVLAGVEILGGLFVAFGIFGPLPALVIAADMFVAAVTVHLPKGFWNMDGGIEYNLVLGVVAVGLALTGPGGWSVDALLGLVYPEWFLIAAVVATVAGVGAALLSREPETAATR
jgi:putative oxidoreductase